MTLVVSFHQDSIVLNAHQIIQTLMVQSISSLVMNLKKQKVLMIISQCFSFEKSKLH